MYSGESVNWPSSVRTEQLTAEDWEPLTVLIDDARDFKDGRAAHTARTANAAFELLSALQGRRIDDLWLDYDLIGGSVQPVVDHLLRLAAGGRPLDVVRIHVHSANVREGHRITEALARAGYPASRSFAANMWRRASPPEGMDWA